MAKNGQKGQNSQPLSPSVVTACPAGKTTAGGLAATSSGAAVTAATGCLSVAANYYASALGASGSTAGTVTACASGSTNAAGDVWGEGVEALQVEVGFRSNPLKVHFWVVAFLRELKGVLTGVCA